MTTNTVLISLKIPHHKLSMNIKSKQLKSLKVESAPLGKDPPSFIQM